MRSPDYTQLTEPVNESNNFLKPRTRGGVVLYSLGLTKGSVIFIAVDTGAEVTREKFHILPMPDVVISHLDALAVKDKKILSQDLTFLYHGFVIPAAPPPFDTADKHFPTLPADAPPPTEDNSSYPTNKHDFTNYGCKCEETEDLQTKTYITQSRKNWGCAYCGRRN